MDFDFNIILVPVTLILGFIWLLDKFWLKKNRVASHSTTHIQTAQDNLSTQKSNLEALLDKHQIVYQDLDDLSLDNVPVQVKQAHTSYRDAKRHVNLTMIKTPSKEPFLVRLAHDFFPVLAVVLIVRSFIIEPFNIPSSSMVPTLYTGDFIAVNKYAYGIRLPLIYNKILDTGSPEHGDVAVFRYPQNPKIYYIKRVIGLPGDTVSYSNKQLSINGQPIPTHLVDYEVDASLTNQLYTPTKDATGEREWALSPVQAIQQATIEEQNAQYYQEELGAHIYLRRYLSNAMQFKQHSNFLDKIIEHDADWQVQVPEHHYFVMGDNSDRSEDGRFWGFVPDENLAGKAFYIWMHKKPGLSLPTFKRNGSID